MIENKNTTKLQEETIDLKAILIKYVHYWYYFIISVLFCLFIAFLHNRYSKPIYSVSSTLLIRDDSNPQLGAENLLEGLEIFSGRTNLKNEIALLNSYSITKQVVEELGLGTSYFAHGKILTSSLFDNLPFLVTVDSTHLQLTSRDFYVSVLNERQYELSVSSDNQHAYNISVRKFDKNLDVEVSMEETYKFGQTVESEHFSFIINIFAFC